MEKMNVRISAKKLTVKAPDDVKIELEGFEYAVEGIDKETIKEGFDFFRDLQGVGNFQIEVQKNEQSKFTDRVVEKIREIKNAIVELNIKQNNIKENVDELKEREFTIVP